MLANAIEIVDRDRGEQRGRLLEVLRPLLQDRRNIFNARENLATARLIVRWRHSERFHERGERLLDVKIRIAFPARINVQFPSHPRQSRPDQPIIDLLRNRPSGRIQLFPAHVELPEMLSPLVDAGSRPIARRARPLDSIYVVASKWLVVRAASPTVNGQVMHR